MDKFHDVLKNKMDKYAHFVYYLTKSFPREEIYGITSQLRRATLSVILNYIEGYARCNEKILKNFLGISFGSLKESEYLLRFSLDEKYLSEQNYNTAIKLSNEIGAMLWTTIRNLKTCNI